MDVSINADQQDVLRELDEIEKGIGSRPAKVKVHDLVLGEQPVMSAVVVSAIIRREVTTCLDQGIDCGEVANLPLAQLDRDVKPIDLFDFLGLPFDFRQ